MNGGGNRVLAGRILFLSALLMFAGAVLIWLRVIPMADPSRMYAAGALAAAAAVDIVMAVFFVKDGSGANGRI